MHEDDNLRDDYEPSAVATADEPEMRPLLDQLRARREEIAAEQTPMLLLEIPRYEGKLIARYRYPEAGYKAVSAAVRRAQSTKDSDAILNGNLDALVASCDGLLGFDGESYIDLRTNIVVDEQAEGLPGFGQAAEMFGIVVPDEIKGKARHVCRHIFSPRAMTSGVFDGDVAAMTQAGEVLQWLATAGEKSAEALAGE